MRTVLAIAFALMTLGVAAGCSSSGSTTGSDGGAGSGGQAGTGGAGGSGGGGGAMAGYGLTHCDLLVVDTHSCDEQYWDIASAHKGCDLRMGTFAMGPCDLTGSTGGCKRVNGMMTETLYYYAPSVTAADVMAQCANDGNATYVAP